MLVAIAKGVVLLYVLAVFTTIMIFLTLWVASPHSTTAGCSAPHVMEQRPDNGTSRPSLRRTESGIDI
jgi:hypothetical protein